MKQHSSQQYATIVWLFICIFVRNGIDATTWAQAKDCSYMKDQLCHQRCSIYVNDKEIIDKAENCNKNWHNGYFFAMETCLAKHSLSISNNTEYCSFNDQRREFAIRIRRQSLAPGHIIVPDALSYLDCNIACLTEYGHIHLPCEPMYKTNLQLLQRQEVPSYKSCMTSRPGSADEDHLREVDQVGKEFVRCIDDALSHGIYSATEGGEVSKP